MGVYDSVVGEVDCLYCKEVNEIEIQLKAFESKMDIYGVGQKIYSGPFADGEYGKHSQDCEFCVKEFFPVAVLEYPIITGLKVYRKEETEKFMDYKPIDLIKPHNISTEKLIDLIVKNCLSLSLELIGNNPDKITDSIDMDRMIINTPVVGNDIAIIYGYMCMLINCSDEFYLDCGKCFQQLKAENITKKLMDELGFRGFQNINSENIFFLREFADVTLAKLKNILWKIFWTIDQKEKKYF